MMSLELKIKQGKNGISSRDVLLLLGERFIFKNTLVLACLFTWVSVSKDYKIS